MLVYSGRAGSKITEIRRLSGSKISIAKTPHDDSGERMFTIVGPPEANEKALFLLYNQLESESTRSRSKAAFTNLRVIDAWYRFRSTYRREAEAGRCYPRRADPGRDLSGRDTTLSKTLLSASLCDCRNRLFSLVPLPLNLTLSLSFLKKHLKFSSHYSSTSDLTTTMLSVDRISLFCAFPYHRSRKHKTATTQDDIQVSLYSFFSPYGIDDYDDASESVGRWNDSYGLERQVWKLPGVSNRSDHFLLSTSS
jgi:hypothetical protein